MTIALDKWFKKNNNTQNDNYKFIKTDLINKQEINYLIQSIKPDFIFHLAAETHVDRSIDSPRVFLESNVIGTFNLLEATYEYWRKLSSDKQASLDLFT